MPNTHTTYTRCLVLIILSVLGCRLSVSASSPTRTLPVIYINTDDRQAVSDTETQIPCGIYIDSVLTRYHSLGSAAAPVRGTIKGRGNWTWNGFDKKPYKIKFDVKHKVLGMPNNRHWCLLAYADDYLGFLKGPAGFAVSSALSLRWTPRQVPVELVLNGRYMGLYFLTEHVRIASNRVHIHEQADRENHPDSITGGWLVEIDNYPSENNIEFYEGNGQHVMISLREPEVLSSAQRNYLESQIYALNEALYAPTTNNQSPVTNLLDINEAAKYYLVQEIMEDCESYHGSCFLYKDRDSLGVTDKWKFGPVWDFGNAYDRHQETWIYNNPPWQQYWIAQLATIPQFQQAVSQHWYTFYHHGMDSARTAIRAFADLIETAAKRDAEVWRGTQGYCDNSNYSDVRDRFFRRYDWRVSWLFSQWGEGTPPATEDLPQPLHSQHPASRKLIRDGQLLIIRGDNTYNLSGQRVE